MNAARIVTGILLTGLLAGNAFGASGIRAEHKPRLSRLSIQDNGKLLDINNISMIVTNTGSFAYDHLTGNAGLEFPKGTGKTAVFAAGLWMGAKVGTSTRIAISEYSDECGPGPAVGGVPANPTLPEFKVYKLNRVYADGATRDAELADYTAGAVPYGAPPVAVQPDGSLNVRGDQMCWSVYNDLDPTNHTNKAGSTPPLGVEVQQTTFAFNRQGALGNTIFIRYKLVNRGTNTLSNMYISQWSDPDLGGFTDDLVGCDTTLSVGFIYNGTNSDAIYGTTVPSVGYDFFKGPTVGGVPLGMSSFNKYVNGGGPQNADQTYDYMKGLGDGGVVLVNPTDGKPTTFNVSGDPVLGKGWLDSSPGDRRLMLSSGPFTMAPGDTQEVVTAIVIGQSSNRFASISLMKFYDSYAQVAFDANFNLPNPPSSPTVNVSPLDSGVRLTWDRTAENYSQAPYNFEGYNVYQGASIAGPFTRIVTYDLVNGITTVLDPDFDEEQGLILPTGKAFGTDSGIQYSISLNADAVRGGQLHNGTQYYYTVNAYSVGIGEIPQVLESANNVLAVVPQTPAAGVDLSTAKVSDVTQQVRSNTIPATTDAVTVVVVDPPRLIKADYTMGYKPSAAGELQWYVVRATTASTDTILANQTNFSGDDNYPIFDGLQLKIVGSPLGFLTRVTYDDVGPNAPGLKGDPSEGGAFFDGSADFAAILAPTGSALDPADNSWQRNIEIRFTGTPTGQKAYRYLRCNCSPRNYNYQDYVDVPFTVWDIDNDRQLNAAFLENFAAANGVWDPDSIPDPFDSSVEDDRQFVSIYASDYSATPLAQYQGDWLSIGSTLDIMYTLWPLGVGPYDSGDKVSFALSRRSTNDYFTFSSTAPNPLNVDLAKSELNRVLAVPNPYFAHSSYELNQFARVVKFTHLPAQCTVRIFNLAGDLVRTLAKNDGTSQLTWDLLTDRGLPVGSGVYLFHVEAPNIGTKIGKVAIFMEEERLNNF